MRRLFIIRKDLHLTPGKLAAMVGHCAEGYWLRLLQGGSVTDNEFTELPVEIPGDPGHLARYRAPAENSRPTVTVSVEIPKETWDGYVRDIFTKTICEAKNLNQLIKAGETAKGLGLVENVDYGFIDDVCRTELTPEFTDENGVGRCRVGIWFRPLPDDISHAISKKYQLYRD